MKRPAILAAAVIVGMAAIAAKMRSAPPPVEDPAQCCRESVPLESAGLCPWRDQQTDREVFFPGADHTEQRLLALSDLRPEILARLGKGGVTDGNALYIYRIFTGTKEDGVVLVQRAPGQYGAIEYVIGMSTAGRLIGLRIQSQREPDRIAKAIAGPAWLGAFAGKTASDGFKVGGDLPDVTSDARQTATALAESVRRLVIETTVGQAHGRG